MQLAAAEIDTPRLDSQLLLAWTLRARREDLAREPERTLTGRERLVFDKAVSLRARRRPLPYITGEQVFYGRSFKINRAVLIPRPETELLVEAALQSAQSALTPPLSGAGGSGSAPVPPELGVRGPLLCAPRIADIGTGSGCLAVTLACKLPEARVFATDICANALSLARKNVVRYGMQDRVTLLHGDLLSPLPPDIPFDLIVSNPPYITEAEMPDLQPEVRDYEPPLALTGQPGATGADGTRLHRRLIAEAPPSLRPGGWLILEVGLGQAQAVAGFAEAAGYAEVAIQNDLAGIPRIVLARRP